MRDGEEEERGGLLGGGELGRGEIFRVKLLSRRVFYNKMN